uniref:Uncharacterized protein n=1 Tax=Anguilla anguilla TaxID=7936 RepID=A0A0E9XTX8_ANGAN
MVCLETAEERNEDPVTSNRHENKSYAFIKNEGASAKLLFWNLCSSEAWHGLKEWH